MGTRRITYFDTTKGLLMLLLVWGHMIIFAKALGISTEFNPVIQNTVPFYRVFFMQTFFFITGYCTTWNTTFIQFLIKNLKTIVFPAFIFMPLTWLTRYLLGGTIGMTGLIDVFYEYIVDGIPWFLSALFITKILYWSIRLNKSPIVEWIIIIVFFIIGLVCHEMEMLNNWFYQQAFLMLPFMAIGRVVSKVNERGIKILNFNISKGGAMSHKSLWIISIPYFMLIMLWQILGLHLGFPAVDAIIDIHYITALFYISFAISGTALILALAQKLHKVSWINIIGRQSLFIYLAHTFVVICLMKIYSTYATPSGFLGGALFYLSIYVISIIIMFWGCRLWENRNLSWMLGKF